MKHTHHLGNDGQTLRRNFQPRIESSNQLRPDVLAGMCEEIVKRAEEDLQGPCQQASNRLELPRIESSTFSFSDVQGPLR